MYRNELHDDGAKTILRRTGRWGPADVTGIVLDGHPDGRVAASHVSRRLARFLYRPDPEPEVVDAMAGAFVSSGYDIKAMVKTLLLRPEFSDGAVLTIKSPAEYVAGTLRLLGLTGAIAPAGQPRRNGADEIAGASTDMGQELFDPPDVSGWRGGAAWANTAATLARYNFTARIGKLVTDNTVRTVLERSGGEPRDTAPRWMHRLGLLSLLPSTEAALARYLDASPGGASVVRAVAIGQRLPTALSGAKESGVAVPSLSAGSASSTAPTPTRRRSPAGSTTPSPPSATPPWPESRPERCWPASGPPSRRCGPSASSAAPRTGRPAPWPTRCRRR